MSMSMLHALGCRALAARSPSMSTVDVKLLDSMMSTLTRAQQQVVAEDAVVETQPQAQLGGQVDWGDVSRRASPSVLGWITGIVVTGAVSSAAAVAAYQSYEQHRRPGKAILAGAFWPFTLYANRDAWEGRTRGESRPARGIGVPPR